MFTHILTVGFIPTENDLFLPSLLKDNYPYFDLIEFLNNKINLIILKNDSQNYHIQILFINCYKFSLIICYTIIFFKQNL